MAKQLKINYSSAYLKYQLTKGLWLIHKQSSYGQLSTVFDFLDNKLIIDDDLKEPEMTIPYTVKITNSTTNKSRNIAVIPINGSLMKYDYCGAPGMQTIISRIKRVEEDDSISGILFHVDSPGGTVDGTQELGDVIKNCSKPTIGFADGLAASAAYWAISSTDMVIAKDTTTEVGSIGVVLSFIDNRKALEKEGYVIHEIFADGSPEKWKEMLDVIKGDDSTLKEWTLNPILDEFQESVRNNMPGVNEKALKGRVYLAKHAKKMKLINKIGNFDFAVKELNKLINKNIMEKEKVVEMTVSEDEKGLLGKIKAAIKPEIKDISEETKTDYENQLSEKDKKITELENTVTELNTNIEDYGVEKGKLEKDFDNVKDVETALTEENETFKMEIASLKSELIKKADTSTKVTNDEDKLEIGDMSDDEKAWLKEVEKMQKVM
jgi:protease-4